MIEIRIEPKDLTMMKSATQWPSWPILPIKKTGKNIPDAEGTGILIADHGPVIFFINMYAIDNTTDFNTIKKERFSSFEEIVRAGWIVD
jgi:hypothetical protein